VAELSRAVFILYLGLVAYACSRGRARGGRAHAAKARGRKAGLRHAQRSSEQLVEAAQPLGEMLRSDDLRVAQWADGVISLGDWLGAGA
jgi:hypothetical protein